MLIEDMFQAFIGYGRTDTRAKSETVESAMLKKKIPTMNWRIQAVMVLFYTLYKKYYALQKIRKLEIDPPHRLV